MLGPFATTSRLTPIHQMSLAVLSLAVLSHAACASMSTTTTTTTRDRRDRYGPMEWAQKGWKNTTLQTTCKDIKSYHCITRKLTNYLQYEILCEQWQQQQQENPRWFGKVQRLHKLPIGCNGPPHIRFQNYPSYGPIPKPNYLLILEPIRPTTQTESISDQPFCRNALVRQTHRPTDSWSECSMTIGCYCSIENAAA